MVAGRSLRSSFPALGRNVVSGRRHTFTGYVPSSKEGNDFRLIAYESILERDFIQLLEDDRDVISYADRSDAVLWEEEDGTTHRYLPDFDVLMRDGSRICVEVKPFRRIVRHNLLPLYRRIESFAIASGRFKSFEIWTDREIRQRDRLYNAEVRNIGRLSRQDLSSAISVINALRARGGRCSLGELRHASGLEGASFWAVIASVVSSEIQLEDRRRPIDDGSIVVMERGR